MKALLHAGMASALLSLALMMGGGVACEREGPAEKAGKKIDKAVDDAGDEIEDATDK